MRIVILAAAAALLAACQVPENLAPPAGQDPPNAPNPTCGPRVPGTPLCPGEKRSSNPEKDFLAKLRAEGVPVSKTGSSEIKIGRGICQQIAAGRKPQDVSKELTSVGWTREQTIVVSNAAQKFFC